MSADGPNSDMGLAATFAPNSFDLAQCVVSAQDGDCDGSE